MPVTVHKGSWFGLPDFGITEKLAGVVSGGKTSDLSNAITGKSSAYVPPTTTQVPTNYTQYNSAIGPVQPQVKGASTGFNTGGQTLAGQGVQTQAIQNQVNTGNNAIDTDYNDYINSLNSQQGYVQEQGSQAMGAMNLQANQARTQYGQEKNVAQQGLDTQAQTAQTQAKTGMQSARDMYNQVQQQNIAQLSGAGLSSSSVAEALAEKLGVETARRIAGITGSRDEVLQNLSKEKSNLDTYYQQKLTNLEDQLTLNTRQIQSQLLQSIDQINQARNVAASDRANKRASLLSEAQTQIANLTANAQQFAQSLQTWQAQNSAKLSEVSKNTSAWAQNFNNSLNTFQQAYPGAVLTPQFSQSNEGYIYPSGVNTSIKKKEDGTDTDLTF